MNDLLSGSALLDMDHSLDVMFAPGKESQSAQDSVILDSPSNQLPSLLPNEPGISNFSSEASIQFSATKQEPPPSPVVKVEKEKLPNKRRQAQTASNRSSNKRKKVGSTRQEEHIAPLYQLNREVHPISGRFPFGAVLDRSSMPQTNSPHQSFLLPNTLSRQVGQWNSQSVAMNHPVQIRPVGMQMPSTTQLQHVPQGLRSIQPSPDPSMKLMLQGRREYPSSPAFPNQNEELRAVLPSRGSSVSPDDVPLGNELRSDSGSGSLQQMEGLSRRASDPILYRKVSDSIELSNYNPVSKNEAISSSSKLKSGRLQQRDSQVLVHIVGMKEPFGMIAVDRSSDRVDYVRKMVEKHFADVVGKRAFVFLSHDGVMIKKTQEKELLVWNQTYEKVRLDAGHEE